MRRGLSLLLATLAIAGWSQAAASPRGRVLAVGGVYFKSANPRAQHDWYVEHLSIGSVEASGGWYAVFAGELAGKPPSKLGTTWTVLPPSAANFNGPWMIDYLVDHLDALMQRLKAEGVRVEPKIVTDSRGKFGWAYDGEGNKLELWEPAEVPQATSFDLTFGIGGVYFKARNQAAQYAWYAKHLGIVAKPNKGVRFPWQLSYLKLSTTWDIYPASSKAFAGPFMIAYAVDDLTTIRSEVKADPKVERRADGKHAWVYDGDGNKLELWEPLKPAR